ncbi:ESAT-6-like protein OS=Tsukamurella paurometabola (strain ATCC 8368 / DSM / CCUG 35730 / CIP 100753 / JCM 10117 / KCTC 9821 / NBRC 16120 / NCIMB 702349/ NCTC 13040) OX=521096 GN=Tpau_3370 PE=3 SV=1 [Tsukamurella paurometabola]|uniref:ESAT-6-like protein n=1 Tax=Tsukamurella paurometabola (strain ATCC 8368 / DSM 20162 / CCUG 35730 / CIP 100753 / JCM 10117 / KCTC 9821 / NBRC 16120 / NCIMB 702349 / NCTC 13040) TaxID=521096 RepID=D5UWF5_TSUPD|nr:WXG100 family type VII secretion target [Tsukamurella paurometabola]ADG79954.1 conserved hypothetical protein [Tsukamurella paurometabola DSM 20162]SUP37797.1 Uncharacterized protein conserved in bacteria [Tsukamurella paurometabola]
MGTSAELAEMKAGADSLEELGAQMNSVLAQLRSDVEMTRSAWVGTAQIAFNTVMTRWDENTMKLNTAINDISSMLAGNTVSYNTTEAESEQDLNSIGATLSL